MLWLPGAVMAFIIVSLAVKLVLLGIKYVSTTYGKQGTVRDTSTAMTSSGGELTAGVRLCRSKSYAENGQDQRQQTAVRRTETVRWEEECCAGVPLTLMGEGRVRNDVTEGGSLFKSPATGVST